VLNSKIKGSKLETIANSAHLPQEEQPQAFIDAIAKHWDYLNK
jgi:pimeloyl-ACP methyl ester carboxylesterase